MQCLEARLMEVVERVCERGCGYVDDCLDLLATGQMPEELQSLSNQDCNIVHEELKAIMAVYHPKKIS